ncbi:MAG: hypothetical protein ATN36_06305 [Epulopiscium sp. Nele67-Bin005]|nr:MAG: hypothetical protein ATN36_06305 [Epulopiscium sp. Nele67-Bin005]
MQTPTLYFTLDCEFNDQGFVRELAILLYKENQIVRVLEVVISPSGAQNITYSHQQNNYHLCNTNQINTCINGFLESCKMYAPLSSIKIVGMSLEHDLKSLLKTTKKKSLLNTMPLKTQLEMCGRGTLETKATNYNIPPTQIEQLILRLTSEKHVPHYKYHTALYDAIVTGYVYLRVMGNNHLMGIHSRFKKCTHTYFDKYYSDLKEAQLKKRQTKLKSQGQTSSTTPKIPKHFPEIRYRVQKNISNVFDVVARELFYHKIARLRFEPHISKINHLKEGIMKDLYVAKSAVIPYDTTPSVTDPYNVSLVHAGILLVEQKISVENFIDFAIYMQQYNLPKDKGTYYRVWNNKKEIYVRCLEASTAKKLLTKYPYATIEQFLRKEVPKCSIEALD